MYHTLDIQYTYILLNKYTMQVDNNITESDLKREYVLLLLCDIIISCRCAL